MRITEQTLLEQVRITDFDLAQRKALLAFAASDEAALGACRGLMEPRVATLVAEFYEVQTRNPEIAGLIGDADTLRHLHATLQRYVLDLFSGRYDLDYVNHRLRLGLVHKRIGLEPRLYLAAVQQLMARVRAALAGAGLEAATLQTVHVALDKLAALDATLFFESYLRSVSSEISGALQRSEAYVHDVETTLRERTRQLEELARTDALTGLINRRHLSDALAQALSAAQRRSEPLSLAIFDIDRFQQVNELRGHPHGDTILRGVGAALGSISRAADSCFRYGGDEFCVILPNCSEDEAMKLYCTRVQKHLAEVMPSISLSVGLCSTGPETYLSADDLLGRADANLYQAKSLAAQADITVMPEDSAVDIRRIVQRGTPR
jgi:diguanylate cyclase (GGDEF)-like protein